MFNVKFVFSSFKIGTIHVGREETYNLYGRGLTPT